jgi:hypothetical protein
MNISKGKLGYLAESHPKESYILALFLVANRFGLLLKKNKKTVKVMIMLAT